MDYGNTTDHLKRSIIFGFILGVITDAIALISISVERGWSQSRSLWLLPLCLTPVLLMSIVILVSMLFRIRLTDGIIQHMYMGRFILSESRVEDLRSIKIHEKGYAMVLEFQAGNKIHFLFAQLQELRRLTDDLIAQCPHPVTVE